MHNIRLNANLEKSIAHSAELEAQMGDITFEQLTVKGRARLAAHKVTGQHKITQTQGSVDHFVNLEGPASLAIEVGHHNKRTGEFTRGIHVLGRTLFESEATFDGGD